MDGVEPEPVASFGGVLVGCVGGIELVDEEAALGLDGFGLADGGGADVFAPQGEGGADLGVGILGGLDGAGGGGAEAGSPAGLGS